MLALCLVINNNVLKHNRVCFTAKEFNLDSSDGGGFVLFATINLNFKLPTDNGSLCTC